MPYIGLKPPAAAFDSTDIAAGSIANSDIQTGAVTPHALAAGAVQTAKLDDAAVTGAKVAAAGLGSNTLASGAVTAAKVSIASLSGANAVFTHVDNTFTGAIRGNIVTLGHIKAEGAVTSNTVTLNLANGNFFSWTTNAAITVANPISANTGQCGSIIVTSNGNYTVSFAENWRFPSGTAPTLSTTAGQQDRIDYLVVAANAVHAVASVNLDDKA